VRGTNGGLDKRWMVERVEGEDHDVGAQSVEIKDGALVFYNGAGQMTVAYAAGQWREVWEQ
jgi:predicted GH43/DUF377 family glycosyl hydrolase